MKPELYKVIIRLPHPPDQSPVGPLIISLRATRKAAEIENWLASNGHEPAVNFYVNSDNPNDPHIVVVHRDRNAALMLKLALG